MAKKTTTRTTRKPKAKAKSPPPSSGFTLKQPVSVWNKPLKADFPAFFKRIGKSALGFGFQSWESGAKSLIDALGEIGLKTTPEEGARGMGATGRTTRF